MILISIDNLIEGMIVAKPVFRGNGSILLNEGMEIKSNYIDKLKEIGIEKIYIREITTPFINIDDVIRDKTKQECLFAVNSTFETISLSTELDIDKIKGIVSSMVNDLIQHKDILVNLATIRAVDDYTFGHSLNVGVLSMITGISLGYTKNELLDLGTGAILHDIGKTMVNNGILNKDDKLSEEEFNEIKKHTTYGYELLSKNLNIKDDISNIILYHHERFDGKGYPHGLKGKDIHEYARIASVSDVYDALTSNRVYKQRIESHQAIEYLISMGGHQFDYDIVKMFIQNISIYPVGKGVLLSTGDKGYVVSTSKAFPTRPIVKILYNSNNRKLSKPYDIDLTRSNSITIIDTIENLL